MLSFYILSQLNNKVLYCKRRTSRKDSTAVFLALRFISLFAFCKIFVVIRSEVHNLEENKVSKAVSILLPNVVISLTFCLCFSNSASECKHHKQRVYKTQFWVEIIFFFSFLTAKTVLASSLSPVIINLEAAFPLYDSVFISC